jgi:prepilin-type processing-associated H-X9-DG protein
MGNNLNDAAFAFGMEIPIWIDAPGTYHDGGCGFAFADGHSESHH